jgi:uncharacterized protein (TIGR02246 family)
VNETDKELEMTEHTPTRTVELVSERITAGDVDGALALYEPQAAFTPQPGQVVTGAEAIRQALQGFTALQPKLQGEVEKVIESGDVALVLNRWTLEGTAPDGAAIEMGGLSADVLRRQSDGRWLVLIDDPWGGG